MGLIELYRLGRGGIGARLRSLALLATVVMAGAVPARAYNCGGTHWQTISVSLSSNLAAGLANYTLNTSVPSLDGCDLTTSTNITIIFPGTTNVATLTSGTLNGTPITNFVSQSGDTLTFTSPIAVNNNAAVAIILNNVTNDSSAGGKTLSVTATPVQNGSIGTTTSNPYTLIIPTATFTPTSTRTPTITLTPTETPTIVTYTPTPTVTDTPTPGLCTGTTATNPCVPGGGSRKTDCAMEWLTSPVPPPARSGIPKNKLVCYEGDPACDFDSNLTNRSCSFQTRICINNPDPRLSTCVPSDLKTFEVKSPNPARFLDPADTANLLAIENQAGFGGLNVTVARKDTQIYVGSANAAANACTNQIGVQVPLRVTSTGKVYKKSKRLRIKGTNSLGKVDTDALRLECRPSTCGDGVLQSDHESCDDGNRNNGDGCNQGCQIEPPPPTPTFTRSSTPTNTISGPTPTATNTVPATATFTPAPLTRTCTLRSGAAYSAVRIKTTLGLNLTVSLSGFQSWGFAAQDGNGVRQVSIPASTTHFNGVLVLGVIKVCPRAGGDGNGFIDCDGGETDYDATGEWDHNTSDPPGVNGGHPQDPDCNDSFTNPGGLVSNASIESPTDIHPGICNGPLKIATSGTFAAGGMKLNEQLIVRILSDTSLPCPPDNTPLDEASGDISISGVVTTGAVSGTVFNAMSSSSPWALTETNLTDSSTGAAYGCANIDASVMNVGKLNLSIPAIDLSLSTFGNADLVATLSLVCQ